MNQHRTQEEILADRGFQEIVEWTFLYDGTSIAEKLPYNLTFFEGVGGVSYSEWKSEKISAENLIAIVTEKLEKGKEILQKEVVNFAREKNREIEIAGLESMLTLLEMAKLATPIELEKSSREPIISTEEREINIAKIESLQTGLFGGRISENLEEVTETLRYIREIFHTGEANLSQEEGIIFAEIFAEIREKLEEIHDRNFPELSETEEKKSPEIHPFTEKVLKQYAKVKIPRKIYMRIFQSYFDLLNLPQKVRKNPNVSSIYDGEKYLEIPTTKEYDFFSLERVLSLMAHEIGSHAVNQDISEKNNLQIRGKGNVEKEEGLAKIMESITLGKQISDASDAWHSYPYLLAGELLSRETRSVFTTLIVKAKGIVSDDPITSRELRFFRGFPFGGKNTQRKDCTYTRGKLRIISAIQSGKYSLGDFFCGKIGIDDILSGRVNSRISKETIRLPFLFPDLLIFMLGEEAEKPDQEAFRAYIFSKYTGIFEEKNLIKMTDFSQISENIWTIAREFVEEIRAEN